MKIIKKPFECMREDLVIRGNEFLVDDREKIQKKRRAIIISHGFAANSSHFDEIADIFASWGYATYSFDFCGGCIEGEGKSDGSSLEMTVETEYRDLCQVIDYVSGLPYIDKNRITLLGSSQGGLVSVLAASRLMKNDDINMSLIDAKNYRVIIENLLLLCPALSIPDNARAGVLAGEFVDTNNLPDQITRFGLTIGKKYYEDVVSINPFDVLKEYKGRVFFVHGMKDSLVPYEYSVRGKEIMEEEKAVLYLMPEAEHNFLPEEVSFFLEEIKKFLQ